MCFFSLTNLLTHLLKNAPDGPLFFRDNAGNQHLAFKTGGQAAYNENMKFAGMLFKSVLGLCLLLGVLLVPLLGLWLSSSLAVYRSLPLQWVYALAALVFPLLPLLWELWATVRFRKKHRRALEADQAEPRRRLRFFERFVLRTLLVNLSLLALFLGLYPQASFVALASQGDWFLPEQDWAQNLRPALHQTADAFEWVYNWSRHNPYTLAEEKRPQPTGSALPQLQAAGPVTQSPKADSALNAGHDESESLRYQDLKLEWPLENRIHPLIQKMQPEHEDSLAAVAAYLDQEQDPVQRVKAIYDFVATRITYDVPRYRAYQMGQSFKASTQSAQEVLKQRRGVCAGYAHLMQELAKRLGVPMVYIAGESRSLGGDLTGAGHAWNAVQIQGKWYLLDATWGAGYLQGQRFVQSYRSAYFLTPPEVMGVTHFPRDPTWQLRPDPLSRSQFLRQPALQPDFYAQGLRLLAPQQSLSQVADQVEIVLYNPKGKELLAQVQAEGMSERRCASSRRGQELRFVCKALPEGASQVQFFSRQEHAPGLAQAGLRRYQFVGQLNLVSAS